MSRPRKLSSEEMIQIVDAFFEGHGDPGRLKFSSLAGYAGSSAFALRHTISEGTRPSGDVSRKSAKPRRPLGSAVSPAKALTPTRLLTGTIRAG